MLFKLFIEAEVVDTLLALPSARRRRFLTFFRRIQEHPANSSELVERDNDGKILDVCTFEGMEIVIGSTTLIDT